jgi:hypothetical protein
MQLDLFEFLALLPFVTGFLALECLDFGKRSKPVKSNKLFLTGKLTQKELGLDQTREK